MSIVKKNINKVILGNALEVLKEFPAGSVDCVITSSPYYSLRDYGTKPQIWGGITNCDHKFSSALKANTKLAQGGHTHFKYQVANCEKARGTEFCIHCNAWRGELGLEPTPDLYIEHLCLIFDEIKRVLANHGTCWVNLGDTYSSGSTMTMQERIQKENKKNTKLAAQKERPKIKTSFPSKCLLSIPARFQIAMIERGWILRNVIIWHKLNAMPQSGRDRFTIDYEYVFFFVKQLKYYFEQQFEPIADATKIRANYQWVKDDTKSEGYTALSGLNRREQFKYNPLGRNMRTVWTINTKNSPEAHFATFPDTLVERMIAAGCKKGGLVLDPFAGMGTTIKVAKKLGRKGIGIELQKEYCERANQILAGFKIPAKAEDHVTLDNFPGVESET